MSEETCTGPSLTEAHDPEENSQLRGSKIIPVDVLERDDHARGAQRMVDISDPKPVRAPKGDNATVRERREADGPQLRVKVG